MNRTPNRIKSLLDQGIAFHRQGKVSEARSCYQKILATNRRHSDALHLLGLLHSIEQNWADAIRKIKKAIDIVPNAAVYRNSLAEAYRNKGDVAESLTHYSKAISLDPKYWEAYGNQANAYLDIGDVESCEASLKKAISLAPPVHSLKNTEGLVENAKKNYQEAVECFTEAIRREPNAWESYNNLSITLYNNEQYKESIRAAKYAYKLNEKSTICLLNLGKALLADGRWKDSYRAFQKGLEIDERDCNLLVSLGNLCRNIKKYGKAEELLLIAYRIDPQRRDLLYSLAALYDKKTQYARAIKYLDTILDKDESDPAAILLRSTIARETGSIVEACDLLENSNLDTENSNTWNNYLFTLNYRDDLSPEVIFDHHRRWGRKETKLINAFAHPPLLPLNGRRLRVALLSADWRGHPVAQFSEPILHLIDRDKFDLYCLSCYVYDHVKKEELRKLPEHWIEVGSVGDEELAKKIYEKKIDIVIELMGHSSETRLSALARQPAPIQMTYLGYPNTTGLERIQYRITDSFADPPGMTDHLNSETLYRLRRSAWCFVPSGKTPPLSDYEKKFDGAVIFGSFNNFSKLSKTVVELWKELLVRLPKAKLRIKARSLSDQSIKDRFINDFVESGIAPDRLIISGWVVGIDSHLSAYNEVDIALDTFPYHGTTTTCEALYMGVPVISLAGSSHVSRVGASLLESVGIGRECLAHSPEEYIEKAVSLANDYDRLSSLRSGLRSRFKKSCLMDQTGFVREFERALLDIWDTEVSTQQKADYSP